MTISVRAARHSDYNEISSMIAAAFQPDELNLWDYLRTHDSTLTPEQIRLALDPTGRPVACTMIMPRRIRLPGGRPLPGGIITLVACRPEVQRQGYGGATVRDALAFMREQGLAVAILYGHPGYYPRFGFAPVLPHYETMLQVESAPVGGEPLPAATADDLTLMAALHEAHMGRYPCTVEWPAEPWVWGIRNPASQLMLVLPDRQGYACVGNHAGSDNFEVHSAGATSPEAARRLLDGLLATARVRGLSKLHIHLPPDHLLARLALLGGGHQRLFPANAGMVAIPRWDTVLPAGYAVTPEGLTWCGQLVLQAPEAALIQLAMGYRAVQDLLLMPDCALTQPESLQQLCADFPAGFPRWTLEPFWD